MNPSDPSNENPPNPFAPAPARGTADADITATVAIFQRRLLWLTIAFVVLVVGVAGFDIWATNELVGRERFQLDRTRATVVEQARKFRNELTASEENLRKIIQNAELQQRNLQTMAANASAAYTGVLSNNIGTAVVARNTAAAAKGAEDDALIVRNSRRSVQEIEIELRLSLERTRENFRNTSSNLLGTYTVELQKSLADFKKRAYEADVLLAQLKQVEGEVKKTKQSMDAMANALRGSTPPVAPSNGAILPAAPGPGFTIPVTPRPAPTTNNPPPPATPPLNTTGK